MGIHSNGRLDTCAPNTSQNVVLKDPQTPAGRIPFSDLIENPEDILSRPINATPIEQVEWKNGPGSSDPSTSAKQAQRRRKRARSSSPTSQPHSQRAKHFIADKDPLDLDSIGRSLRTPKHEDPLSLLWTNYAGQRAIEDNDEPILPPIPQMTSSPNTPASSKKDVLRRTASCGVRWPTSSTKKRKLNEQDPYSRAKGIFASKKDAILAKSAANQSRVSILVDSIHQSLLRKADAQEGAPSSSSPLPDRHAEFQCSPLRKLSILGVIPEQGESTTVNDFPDQQVCEEDESSEFGDMEIDPDDPDLLSALQAATQKPQSPIHITTPISTQQILDELTDIKPQANASKQNPSDQLPQDNSLSGMSNLNQCLEIEITKALEAAEMDGFEDFDVFDDDNDFATELAELASKMDSQDVANVDGACESVNHITNVSKVSDEDEFDDAFDDDRNEVNDILIAIDNVKSQPRAKDVGSQKQITQNNSTIKRYLIQDIFESHYQNFQGRQQPEKILSIKDERYQHMYVVYLREAWYFMRCIKGAYIHIIGDFDKHGSCIVDDKNNMIILHPDHLISATTVADSSSCMRRAALQDRVKATSSAEPPQVYGHLIHEVFGEVLRQNKWDSASIQLIVEKLMPNYIESLYEINVPVQEAVGYVMNKMPELMSWASIFVTAKLEPQATICDRNGSHIPMAIDKLLELEEHVWSPMYGLKGNIDATIQIQVQMPSDRNSRTLTVPLELKTGKRDNSTQHRAQTALYTLLLSDRYDINVTSGILYYLETSKTFRIEGIRNEIKDLILKRNELASYVHEKLDLPPMIKKEQLCKKCFAQTACFTYHKLVEAGDGQSSGMKDIFNSAVGHLKQPEEEFFRKWDDLLTKEERDAMKFKRELWTMLSTEREVVGRCFANVIIEPGSAVENMEAPKINRYVYTFVKQRSKPGFSFTDSQITVGEPIVVSDEKGHFALAIGFVTSIRPTRLTVAVDRRLQNARRKQAGFDRELNQTFSAIMEVNPSDGMSVSTIDAAEEPTSYRIDKDEFASGMATARNNLLRIMENGLWRARELRHSIIENKPPVFKQTATAYILSGPASQQDLNVDQRKAIEKVMSAKDYALVLGMPGTGKTTTIAHIIRALVSQGKSVLLTSYTHTAVDNILLKIRDDNIPILRLGATGKIHPDVPSFADLGGVPKRTITELEASWTKSKVVATTCLGINHAIFNHRKFDYCIVDEASQITLPVCLGPIRLASTFILVGDHYQLPPLVQNKEAQEGGLDISLFKLLSDRQPSSVVNLEHQYRMAEDIMLLSNALIYDGRLKCGTPAVASRTLNIPNLAAGLESHHYTSWTHPQRLQSQQMCTLNSSSCWISRALDPSRRAIFLNTDTISDTSALGAPEAISGHGTRITNQIEASLVAQLLTTLIRSGVSPKNIGVITFYRSQLALLRTTVKLLAGTSAANDLEMHTADKYQGRDKEVILLSCVRSNDSLHVGELLKDWRRVNVALTRARSKLIILGSLSTLGGSGVPVLEGLSQIMRNKGWVVSLPNGVLNLHYFEGMPTQTQTQSRSELPSKLRGGAMSIGISAEGRTNQMKQSQRTVLASVDGNARAVSKRPAKVVNGAVNVDKFLDRHPLIGNIVDECAGAGSGEYIWDDGL